MRLLKFVGKFTIIILIVFPLVLSSLWTKRAKIEQMEMNEIIELLNSLDWAKRNTAINYGVDRFIENDTVKMALINLLEREIQISEKWWEEYEETNGDIKYLSEKYKKEYGFGEGRGEYLIKLIDKVIELKDRKAINALVAVAHLGNKPTNAVAEYGRYAVDPLINWFNKTKNQHSKIGVVEALGRIVDTCKFDSAVTDESPRNIIPIDRKNRLIKFFTVALRNSDPYIREAAIKPIGELLGDEAIPLIKELNKSDPYEIIEGERGVVYPIREAAAEVLKKLEKERK